MSLQACVECAEPGCDAAIRLPVDVRTLSDPIKAVEAYYLAQALADFRADMGGWKLLGNGWCCPACLRVRQGNQKFRSRSSSVSRVGRAW